jgi:hypothetical protein
VADAFELYNPTHDLCSVIASLAAERAGLPRYEYAVTQPPSSEGETLNLDDTALARKLAAANRCEVLRVEVETLIATIGIDGLRREVLRPVTTVELPKLAAKPFYEVHGEKRVAAGQYGTVIRYEQHFRPFVEHLTRTLAPAPQHAGQR